MWSQSVVASLCSKESRIEVYYQVLRRQLHRDFPKPLVIPSPKALLRHKDAVSKREDFLGDSSFQRFLPDAEGSMTAGEGDVRRVVLCSGKVYYDLLKRRRDLVKEGGEKGDRAAQVAISRVEQVPPFPFDAVAAELKWFPNAEIVWAQQEPRNMDAWSYVAPRIETACKHFGVEQSGGRPRCTGRQAESSPAAGALSVHSHPIHCLGRYFTGLRPPACLIKPKSRSQNRCLVLVLVAASDIDTRCHRLSTFNASLAQELSDRPYGQYLDVLMTAAYSGQLSVGVEAPMLVYPGGGGSPFLSKMRAMVKKLPGFFFSTYRAGAFFDPTVVGMSTLARAADELDAREQRSLVTDLSPIDPGELDALPGTWQSSPAWFDQGAVPAGGSASALPPGVYPYVSGSNVTFAAAPRSRSFSASNGTGSWVPSNASQWELLSDGKTDTGLEFEGGPPVRLATLLPACRVATAVRVLAGGG